MGTTGGLIERNSADTGGGIYQVAGPLTISGTVFNGNGATSSGTGDCVVTMTSDQSVAAMFTINSYTLTVAQAGTGGGVVTPTASVYTYTHGTAVTLTASANISSTFTGWSGDCSGTGSCVLLFTSNRDVTASFDLIQSKVFLPLMRK